MRLLLTLLLVAALFATAPAFGSAADSSAADPAPSATATETPTPEPEPTLPPCSSPTATPTPTETPVEVTPEGTPDDPVQVVEPVETAPAEVTPCVEKPTETPTPALTPVPEGGAPDAQAPVESDVPLAISTPEDETIAGPPPATITATLVPGDAAGAVETPSPEADAATESVLGGGAETGAVDAIAGEEGSGDAVRAEGDPMLTGMPSPGDADQPFTDPLLIGLEPKPVVEAIVVEQAPETYLSSAPAANAKKPKGGVSADTMSPDGSVAAGGTVVYYFKMVNTARNTEHFWIEAETSGAGWSTAVYSEDGSQLLTDRQMLKSGQEMIVRIVVTAPVTAQPGEVVTTTVIAVDNN